MLERIGALLLGLADLAERAAVAPWPVRWLIMVALCQADAAARGFVMGSADDPAGRHWSPYVMPIRYGNGPTDALQLALSLRSLALIVRGMSAYARCRADLADAQGFEAPVDRLDGDGSILLARMTAGSAERRDTS